MRAIAIAAAFWICAFVYASTQSRTLFPGTIDQHPAIDYRGSALNDPVTVLQRALSSGRTTIEFETGLGFLRSVLAQLDVPVESQVLLFSKTGIQHPFTNPENPRALYFNDRVVVGYIPGAPFLELASHDPRQGVIFQTLQQDPGLGRAPQFTRPDRCLTCHLSANSLGVPGILVRSMFTDATGRTRPSLGSAIVDHRTPLEQRWGGWYVTGTHGAAKHMGNAMVSDAMMRGEDAVTEATLNRTTLDARVDTTAYPLPTSDIAALMVFDHQGHAINLLTRLGWETRIAAADARLDLTTGELAELVRETADYLAFSNEARLTAPITGVSGFAKVFAARAPHDRHGRSLAELDLHTRLFKYRCSYMVYSPAFDALPAEARTAVIARLRERITDPATRELLAGTLPGW